MIGNDFFAAVPAAQYNDFFALVESGSDEELKIVRDGLINPKKAAKNLVFLHCLRKYPNSQIIQLQGNASAFNQWHHYLHWNNLTLGHMSQLFPDPGKLKDMIESMEPDETEVVFIDIPLIPEPGDRDLMFRSSLLLFGSEPEWMMERIRKLQKKPSALADNDRLKGVLMAPDLIAALHHLSQDVQAIDFSPVIGGRSSRDRFYRPHVRDVYIPCSFFPLPDTVHGNPTDYLGMYTHDAYGHLGVSSYIPRNIREFAVDLAKKPGFLDQDIDFLLDMVFEPFTEPRRLSHLEQLWGSVLRKRFSGSSLTLVQDFSADHAERYGLSSKILSHVLATPLVEMS